MAAKRKSIKVSGTITLMFEKPNILSIKIAMTETSHTKALKKFGKLMHEQDEVEKKRYEKECE